MADEPENLTLHYLRRLDEKTSEINAKLDEQRLRLTAVETQNIAILQHLDRISADISRIKKRLDLVEA